VIGWVCVREYTDKHKFRGILRAVPCERREEGWVVCSRTFEKLIVPVSHVYDSAPAAIVRALLNVMKLERL
jgi:hypothetical protein